LKTTKKAKNNPPKKPPTQVTSNSANTPMMKSKSFTRRCDDNIYERGGVGLMKIQDIELTRIEQEKGVLIIQSDFREIAYAIDKRRGVMWVINRQTGAQLEIDGDNVYKFADEMMSVADIFLKRRLSVVI